MILENHVKQLYKLLQHKGEHSQVHAQSRQDNKMVDRRLIEGEESLLKWVKQFDNRADLFVGRNPRTKDGKVEKITSISVDLDPIRPKDSPSTFEQLQESIKASKKILKVSEYRNGIIATSGNGCHIYWAFSEPIQERLKEFELGAKLFEAEIRKLIEGEFNVRVDAIYDNPRLVKIIGTTSTKGEVNQRRLARFLSPIDWSRAINGHVRKRILGYSANQQVRELTPIPKTEDVDRSKLDFGLALRLKQDGAKPDDIRAFLKSHGYKAKEDDIERIVSKLFDPTRISLHENNSVEIITPSTHFEEYRKQIGRRVEQSDPELPTGIPTLDRYTNGLKKGSIWVVGARTETGKTSFCVEIAQHLLGKGKRILFFSTEMSYPEIFDRFISRRTTIPYFDIAKGQLLDDDRRTIDEYGKLFTKENLYIHDGAEPSLGEVSKAISNIRPDMVIFDHIQRVGHGTDQRYLELATFVKGFNTLCRQFNCAGIMNSQLKRLQPGEVPALHHFKECGAIEEEAHVAILLSNLSKDTNLTEQMVKLDIAKHRGGPKEYFDVRFIKSISKFEELT